MLAFVGREKLRGKLLSYWAGFARLGRLEARVTEKR